jgi:hypothetical protein
MALQLGRTVSDGVRRVLTRTGGILLAGLLAIQLLVQVSINTAVVGLLPPQSASELGETIGLTLPVSGTVATGVFLVSVAFSAVYFVGLARALTRPVAELSTFPSELYTRRLGRATVSMFLGGVVVMLSVTIGLTFLILPGVFLAVCFLFFIFAVGVEDRGVVDALKRSWGLSRGNRLKLTVVVIFSGVIGAVTGSVGTVLDLAGSPIVADLVSNAISSVLFVLLYGIMASAYLQVQYDDQRGFDGSVTPQSMGNSVSDQ